MYGGGASANKVPPKLPTYLPMSLPSVYGVFRVLIFPALHVARLSPAIVFFCSGLIMDGLAPPIFNIWFQPRLLCVFVSYQFTSSIQH